MLNRKRGFLLLTAASALLLVYALLSTGKIAATQSTGVIRSGLTAKLDIPEVYWYFGYMPVEAIVHHTFWIRNAGADTLRITAVKPGCGCTTAPLSKPDIPPGDSARLSVVFDTKNMIGKMIKDVSFKTNDPAVPDTLITFMGFVNREHPLVKALPSTLRFFPNAANNNSMKKTLSISNGFKTDIDIKVVDYPRALIKVSPLQTRISSGGRADFAVEQTQVETDENNVLESITLEFTGPEHERITIPVVTYFKRKN